jgi:fibronectin type 3 domain-containing protein
MLTRCLPIARPQLCRLVGAWLALSVVAAGVVVALPGRAAAAACDPPITSVIACENSKPGNPPSEWDVSGSGSSAIQGFATDMSVDQGETVRFKVSTPATAYRLDIYRMGYYGGAGARKVASVTPSVPLPQTQPACLFDAATRLTDCGNWAESASWTVPTAAVSGIYLAKLVRTDGTSGSSHIVFVVRDDDGHSDLLFQTGDTTWQAYNRYGGYSLYYGAPSRAYKVSYNRPLSTRDCCDETFVFANEYPMVRWLEANGYDVSYSTGVDTDRHGGELLEHKSFLSVGHDEYWSGPQRANVEAARAAGVNLAFFSGNEIYWKTRWEPSIDGSGASYRTLVSYKETYNSAKIDPDPAWTGTWRDPRFSPPSDGGRPENGLTGTLFTVNCCSTGDRTDLAVEVPDDDGRMRLWRDTSVATLPVGGVATMPPGTLGYEWDEDVDNAARPTGLVRMSTTTEDVAHKLIDYGNTFQPGTATHSLTLYRAPSRALVFGAGTIRWSWGLDAHHDGSSPLPADARMQQATVNLLADMGVQPATRQPGLVAATRSSDTAPPTATLTGPPNNTGALAGRALTITGTAADAGGGRVGSVDVSTDGGATWHPASGRENWSYVWTPRLPGSASIRARATDDSGNTGTPTAARTITVTRVCPCQIWDNSATPNTTNSDGTAHELGVRFRADVNGVIIGIRFHKGTGNTGTHLGRLWTNTGTLLASATFSNETASGWQQVNFASPVPVTAGTTYVASYYAPNGHNSYDKSYFATSGVNNSPLRALANGVDGYNGVYRYGSSGFPNSTYNASNYWVDVMFTAPAPGAPGSLTATAASPTQINVSWGDVSTETAYRLERSLDGSSGWVEVATVGQNVTSYSDTDLVPSTTYYYRVVALNNGGESAPSSTATATTPPLPPPPPSGLTAEPVSSGRIDLSWTDVGAQAAYRVERSLDGTSGWTSVGTTTTTTFSDTGLSAGTTYYYRVVATNPGGTSPPSSVVSATTLPAVQPPPAPTGLSARAVSSTEVELSWTDVPNETGYKVQRSIDGLNWGQVGTVGQNETSYIDADDLVPSTTYYYRVLAYNNGGESPPSSVVSVALRADPPAPPATVSATAISASEIDLSWSDVSSETGYRVERSTDGLTGWTQIAAPAQDITAYHDTGLSAATTYYYRVLAVNANGATASDVVSATTLGARPAAPTGLTATATSQTRIDLSWNDTQGESGYSIERSADGTSGWTAIGTTAQDITSSGDTSVQAATTYYYRVIASAAGGASDPSNVASATTPVDPPATPTGLSADAVSGSRIDLAWTDVTGETGYRVERSADGVSGWTQLAATAQNTTSYADTGLDPATTYYYRVVASNAGGDSAPSAVASATTNPLVTAPPAPGNVTATPSTSSPSTAIRVSWTDVANETGYRVERSADGITGWTQIATTAQNVTVYDDTGLRPATSYSYRIFATNSAGSSPPSTTATATTAPDTSPPTAPTGLTATGGKSKITLQWKGSSDTGGSGLAGYEVWRSATSATSGFTLLTTVTNTTSYANTGLRKGRTYWYYVVAIDGAKNRSAPSNTASATVT